MCACVYVTLSSLYGLEACLCAGACVQCVGGRAVCVFVCDDRGLEFILVLHDDEGAEEVDTCTDTHTHTDTEREWEG